MKDQIKHLFTSHQAAALAGLKPTMVDYLCRSNVLVPGASKRPGRGRIRQYTFGDVIILRALAQLLKQGISVARLKASLQTLRKHHPEITPNSLPAKYLVTDGKKVLLKTKEKVLEDLTAGGQLSFAFVLELQQLQNEVSQKARALKWIA